MIAQPQTTLDILTADSWDAKDADNRILFRKEGTGEVRVSGSHNVSNLFSLNIVNLSVRILRWSKCLRRSPIRLASARPSESRCASDQMDPREKASIKYLG